MNSKQVWTTIVLAFVLLMTLTVGAVGFGALHEVGKILQSPAATGEFDIDADVMMTMSDEDGLQVEYIHLNRVQGELNSKVLDLILLAVNSR